MKYSVSGLENLLGLGLEKIMLSMDLQAKVLSYYKHLFGLEGCVGCHSDFGNYFSKLKKQGTTLMEKAQNRSFELNPKTSSLPMAFGSSRHITPGNLTDALALEYLAKNKKRSIHFTKLPKDWEKQVDAYIAAQGQPVAKSDAKGGTAATNTAPKKSAAISGSKALKAVDAIAKISEATTADEIDEFVAGDDRSTVIAAADTAKAALVAKTDDETGGDQEAGKVSTEEENAGGDK